MITTLNKIRAHGPCIDGWKKLLAHLNKTQADDEPLPIATVIDSNDISDAIWCLRAVEGHDREMRLYSVWCARRVEHLMSDSRSRAALDVAERYAHGRATDAELLAAEAVARAADAKLLEAAAEAAAHKTAWAAEAAAAAAARAASAAAAWAADAHDAERSAQADELRRVCTEIEAGRDPYPEEDGR